MRYALAVAIVFITMHAHAASVRDDVRVAAACHDEAQRFCAGADGTLPTPRNQFICLKPFRNDLSLGCRKAVNDAIQAKAKSADLSAKTTTNALP